MKGAASSPSPARRPSGTSRWVSKQHWEMPGPTAAKMSSGRLPKLPAIRSTARAAMPRAVPRQPAWTAAMARRTGS